MTELNEILLNGMSNSWIKQTHVQVFYCEYITLKYVNMFERTEITESIYKGVVEPFYKKTTGAYYNCAGYNRKMRGESAS